MNEKIREHLTNHCLSNGYVSNPSEANDEILWEVLSESAPLYEESLGNSRWWENTFVVVEIDGMLIGYRGAKTTGDDSPWDVGWEWDLDHVCEVEKKVEVVEVVKYKPIPTN